MDEEIKQEIRQIRCKRLNEVLELSELKRTRIREELEKNGVIVSRQNFCKYVKGTNNYDNYFAEKLAEVLGINKGYLLGYDQYASFSYLEYMQTEKLLTDKRLDSFQKVTSFADLILTSDLDEAGEINYHIKVSDTLRTYSGEEIDFLSDKIKSYIQELIANYCCLKPLPQSKEDWLAYIKWHPEAVSNNAYLNSDEIEAIKDALKEGGFLD